MTTLTVNVPSRFWEDKNFDCVTINTTSDKQKETGFVAVPSIDWQHFEPNKYALKNPVNVSKTW